MLRDDVDRRKLFLFTDRFPWGRGEKPFVIPELEALRREYDVTIISLAANSELEQIDMATKLPDDVGLLHWPGDSKLVKLMLAASFPLSEAGRTELRDLRRDGLTRQRLADSIRAYAIAQSIRRFCRRQGVFDDVEGSVYYCFWFSRQCLAVALERRSDERLKLISRIHGYDLYNERIVSGRQPWQRFMRDRCDKVVFACGFAAHYFSTNYGFEQNPGQYVICGLGVPAARITPGYQERATIRIASCSSIIPLKRVGLIAAALGELGVSDIEWVHFGDGPEKYKVEAAAEKFGLRAMFFGHVQNSEVVRYYEEHHITAFVTATSSEGSPVSIQEALACGIPIIGTNVGGIGEQIDGNGALLPANPTVLEVAYAIGQVCGASCEEWERMSRRSVEIWSEKYDSVKNKTELIRIIESL